MVEINRLDDNSQLVSTKNLVIRLTSRWNWFWLVPCVLFICVQTIRSSSNAGCEKHTMFRPSTSSLPLSAVPEKSVNGVGCDMYNWGPSSMRDALERTRFRDGEAISSSSRFSNGIRSMSLCVNRMKMYARNKEKNINKNFQKSYH